MLKASLLTIVKDYYLLILPLDICFSKQIYFWWILKLNYLKVNVLTLFLCHTHTGWQRVLWKPVWVWSGDKYEVTPSQVVTPHTVWAYSRCVCALFSADTCCHLWWCVKRDLNSSGLMITLAQDGKVLLAQANNRSALSGWLLLGEIPEYLVRFKE